MLVVTSACSTTHLLVPRQGLPDHRRKKKKWHPSCRKKLTLSRKTSACAPSTINPDFKNLALIILHSQKLICELISRFSILWPSKSLCCFSLSISFVIGCVNPNGKRPFTTEAGDFQQARVQQGVHTTNLQTPPQTSLRNSYKGKISYLKHSNDDFYRSLLCWLSCEGLSGRQADMGKHHYLDKRHLTMSGS